MSSLEGAWLITNRKLDEGKPDITLHTEAKEPYVCVGLGASGNYVRVHSAEVARGYVEAFAKAAALLEEAALAGKMDAEITRQQPADLGWRDEATGLISGPLPEPGGYPCTRCGARDVPKVDGRCSNHERCAERAAARDTEAAQVTS